MADQRLVIRNFSAGTSDDDTLGPKAGFSESTAVDIRTSPARIMLQKALSTEASGNSFLGPHTYDTARIANGDVYFANGAYLYKRTPGANGASGTYNEETDSNGNHIAAFDLDYRPDRDALFIYGPNSITELSPLSNSPTYKVNKYSYYSFYDPGTVNLTNQTFTLPTTLVESTDQTTNLSVIDFICTKEPLNRAVFVIDTPGTGDWIFTLHDNANQVVATQTISNADLPKPGDAISFTHFTGTTRMSIGAEYHVHLTTTTGTSKVATQTADSFSSASCMMYADRLVTVSGFVGHCTQQFGADTYFCNERYVGQWEILDLLGGNTADGYDAHHLVLPPLYTSICLTSYSGYLAVACSIDDTIEDAGLSPIGNGSSGAVVLYDGTSDTFEFVLPVPTGPPQAIFTYGNRLFFISSGRLYNWAGHSLYSFVDGTITETYEFPGINEFIGSQATDAPKLDTFLSAARHAMTVYKGLLVIGYPFQTANTNVKIGVYTFGTTKAIAPESMTYDYVTCDDTMTTTFKTSTSPDTPATGVSIVSGHGDALLVGWTNGLGSSSGIDRVNDTSLCAANGDWRSFWFDNNDTDISKTPKAIKVTCEPLPAGCTVTPVIEYDHSGTEVVGTDSDGNTFQAAEGDIDVVYPLDSNDNFYAARFGVNLASADGNQIRITSITFKFDDNKNNQLATEEHRSVS